VFVTMWSMHHIGCRTVEGAVPLKKYQFSSSFRWTTQRALQTLHSNKTRTNPFSDSASGGN